MRGHRELGDRDSQRLRRDAARTGFGWRVRCYGWQVRAGDSMQPIVARAQQATVALACLCGCADIPRIDWDASPIAPCRPTVAEGSDLERYIRAPDGAEVIVTYVRSHATYIVRFNHAWMGMMLLPLPPPEDFVTLGDLPDTKWPAFTMRCWIYPLVRRVKTRPNRSGAVSLCMN